MAYKQNPGRGPMMKTGKGVPSALLQDSVEKKKDEKSGATSGRDKVSYPGATWTRPAFTTEPNTYSRLQEAAFIKGDSTLAASQENRVGLRNLELPREDKLYKPQLGSSYRVKIDPKTGATTFNAGRSDQTYTMSRRDLMKNTSRGAMGEYLSRIFKNDGSGSLRKK
jgi:hypothetical protein